jgi:hypothetical protein
MPLMQFDLEGKNPMKFLLIFMVESFFNELEKDSKSIKNKTINRDTVILMLELNLKIVIILNFN